MNLKKIAKQNTELETIKNRLRYKEQNEKS